MSVPYECVVVFLCVLPGCLVVVGLLEPYAWYLGFEAVSPSRVFKLDVPLEVFCAFCASFSLERVGFNLEVFDLSDEFFFGSVRVVYGEHY